MTRPLYTATRSEYRYSGSQSNAGVKTMAGNTVRVVTLPRDDVGYVSPYLDQVIAV